MGIASSYSATRRSTNTSFTREKWQFQITTQAPVPNLNRVDGIPTAVQMLIGPIIVTDGDGDNNK
ncbi:MAG: hypothetical protein M0T74_17200 [Desulfitobacterium hafniense]|nr:hypothetical protein [Desulfitobacterium hafniense]